MRNLLIASVVTLLLTGCLAQETVKTPDKPTLPEPCTLTPETGKCKAAFKRYYFNPETHQCESFLYGGCGGRVPFDTLEACRSVCQSD